MNKPNVENLEKEEEGKFLKKKKRKKVKMRVSGSKIKELGRIINNKKK